MAKKKKKTRKELLKEPDEFLTFTSRIFRVAVEHQKKLMYALSTLIAIALIISAYSFFVHRAEAKAFLMLQKSLAKYEAVQKDNSPDEVYRNISKDLQQIVDKYGGNAGGRLARVIYGNICYDAGQYSKAIKLYEKSLDDFKDNELVYNLILNNLGYAYGQIGDQQNATKYFEKLASATDSSLHNEALFNLGLLHDKMGNAQKSTDAFKQILSKQQDSIYFDIVEEKLIEKGLNPKS
jgi:tetratricopeptide (TPR) repeat protein